MNTLYDGQPEEFLLLLKNFKIATNGTGTTNPSSQINLLRMMLRVQALMEFDGLQSQYVGSTNKHLKLIQEGLLDYFFPVNFLSKKKRAMERAMRKPRSMILKHFAERLK